MIKRIETIAFEECSHNPPCHYIEYPTEKRFINQEDKIILGINPDDSDQTQTCNFSELQGFDQCTVVSFSTQLVETISTELNYDGQSLVGDVGGWPQGPDPAVDRAGRGWGLAQEPHGGGCKDIGREAA